MSFCYCGSCGKWFNSFRSRQEHLDAPGHEIPYLECDTCERVFRSYRAKEQHMNDTGHWANDTDGDSDGEYYECRACEDEFSDEEDRDEHEIEECLYCADCDRCFGSLNNIRSHLNSRIHRGTIIPCPFCKLEDTTANGLCQHLESGSCNKAPFLDRDKVYRLVHSKDPHGIITKKYLDWYEGASYEANERAWNGYGYECYLCHNEFTKLHGLNQHLNSPRHRSALYHCPNRGCRKNFTTLGGVMNHLESEACGYMRFEAVQHSVKDVISGDRLIKFR